ncbi:oligosaccharide flippase family protein [Sphingomonas adhaesiva]|uniref:oligosaccharide flippase family protein n=1 Tax=Sphingomonas adhaesiva TaxID=28212 RepID=UPI002FFD236D
MATVPASPAPGARGAVFWSTVNGGASVLLPFIVFALFARLMSPADLSLAMVAVAMLELLKVIGPQGVYDVVLAYPEEDRRHYRTAGALFLLGGIVTAMVFAGAVLASGRFLDHPLPPVLLILIGKVVFDYAILQPQAILVRRGAMRRLGSRGLAAGVVAGAIGLGVALVATPMTGLAIYYVAQSFVLFAMTAMGTGAWLAPAFDATAAREMASQATRASGVRLSAGVSNYFDQILLSAMAAPAQVGPYNLGKRLEVVVITMSSSFSQLLFQPTFARAGHDERLHLVARGLSTITLICGLPVALFAAFHRDLVPLLFGPQWRAAAGVVALLAVNGFIRALGGVAGALMTVTQRNGRLLALSAFAAVSNMALIALFAAWGVIWAAAAIVLRNLMQTIATLALTSELAGHVPALLIRRVLLPIAVTTAVALGAEAVARLLVSDPVPLVRLAIIAISGALGGVAGLLIVRRQM